AGLLLDVAELREASGRRREAAEMTRSALEALDAHGDDVRYERATACQALAQAAAESGQTQEAATMVRRAADLAAELGDDPLLSVPASLLLSHLEAARGDVPSALAWLEQAERSLAALPHHPLRIQADAARAGLARMQGEPGRAVALARESVRRAEDTPWLPAALCFLAEQQHQSGELSDAESSYESALH